MTFRFDNATRLVLVGLAAAWISACNTNKPTPPLHPPTPAPQGDQYQGNESSSSQQLPGPNGPAPGSQQDFVINVGELIYFDFDKADIRADAQPILDGQSAWLRRYPDVRVRIEGNCDERGTREYNFALGAKRAEAVRAYLIAHGVGQARITTISYGKEKPIDPGSDEQAWARNRNGRTASTAGAR